MHLRKYCYFGLNKGTQTKQYFYLFTKEVYLSLIIIIKD
jgi:hypothetical protein